MTRALTLFSILCGLGMFGAWGTLFLTGQVPEIRTEPIGTGFLLAAEFLTAGALLLGGLGQLAHQAWSQRVEAIALGMLLYCSLFSIGVFGQAGNPPATAFFVVIALVTLLFAGWLGLRHSPAAAG